MLTRIFGLHGTGKTEVLLARLEECVKQKKQAFLVVPEQAAVSAERLLIDRLGNPANMYIEVINFKRLCNRVFRESGGLVGHVPDNAASELAMSHVLSQSAGLLKEYGSLACDTAFAKKMLVTVSEMHRFRVTPNDLDALCAAAGNALEECSGAKDTGAIKALLREHGAVTALMTGSGAAVFGVFRDEGAARAAAQAAKRRWKQVYVAQPDRGGARVSR